MKTKAIIVFFLLSIIFTGCRKHECNALSWTDYNTVEDVWCNFKYFEEESKTHIGDTLKVYGWLVDSNKYWYMTMTSVKELQFSHEGDVIYSNPWVILFIRYPESQLSSIHYDSTIYALGTIFYNKDIEVLSINVAGQITNKP